MLDNKTNIFCVVYRPPFKILTIPQPDMLETIWIPDLSGILMVTDLDYQQIQ